MTNKERILATLQPDPEQPFPPEEYKARLVRIRERMARDKIDLLFVGSPDGLNYVTGYQCEWYQAQSPRQWPGTSGVAIHVDHDRAFEPGTVINYENQFYLPREDGHFFEIERLMFKSDRATLMSGIPYGLTVIE